MEWSTMVEGLDFLNSGNMQDKLDQPMKTDGEARPGLASSKWVSALVGLLIAVAGLVFHLSLELRLERLKVFNQYNIFFGADPNEVLSAFAHGGAHYRRGLVHPNLGNFFTVPIRAFVKTLSIIFPDRFDKLETEKLEKYKRYLRRRLAFLIVPISASLFYLIFHRLLLLIGFSLPLASLFTLLAFVSFSQVLFGSIPESYAISNLAIALAYLLFVISRGRSGMPSFIAWTAVGMFAAGITITNIFPVITLFWLREIYNRNSFAVSIVKASGMAALVLALTLTLNVMSNFVAGVKQRSLSQEVSWLKRYGTRKIHIPLRKFLTFPSVLVNSIIPPVPRQQPNKFAIKMNPEARYSFKFTFDYSTRRGSGTPVLSARNLAGIVLFLLLLLPIRASPNTDRSLLLLSWGSLLIIGFNWGLHSVWGQTDRMLYSQHWHVSLNFLLAALVATQLRFSLVRTALVAASVILVAVNNLVILRSILAALTW